MKQVANNTDQSIALYTVPSAKQLCETEGFDYTYYQLDEDFTRDELMGIFPNARTFPQIHDDGKLIGGFDDFAKYVENEYH